MSETSPINLFDDVRDGRAGTPFIFTGPSTHGVDLTAWPDLSFVPPAAAGDILVALKSGASAIGVIDGYFETRRAVWHKELLWALEEGVPVCGASSMGALRAAELHTLGMEGVGQIFAWYRDGVLTDDDEVTLLHGPPEIGHMPLTAAMANLRYSIDAAALRGELTPMSAEAIITTAKALFYKDRTAEMIAARLPDTLDPPRGVPSGASDTSGDKTETPPSWLAWLTAHLAQPENDLKRQDAVRLIERVSERASSTSELAGRSPSITAPRTQQIMGLANETGALS